MMKKWRQMGISRKFTVSFSLIIIVPLIVCFILINIVVIRKANEQDIAANLATLKQTVNPIEFFISDMDYISVDILANDSIQAYLNDLKNDRFGAAVEDKIAALYMMQTAFRSRDYIGRVSLFLPQEILIQFGNFLKEETQPHIEQLNDARGRAVWIPAASEDSYMMGTPQKTEVALMRAVNDVYQYQSVIGYLRLNVEEEYVCSLYSSIASASTLDMFLIDRDGNVISSMNKERLCTTITGEDYFSELTGKRDGSILSGKNVISYAYVKDLGWKIVKIDPKSSILSGRWMQGLFILAILLILLFCIGFLLIQRRNVILPLRAMSDDLTRFNEDASVLKLHTNSQDEIGQLNDSIIHMGRHIEDLIQNVYKSQIRERESQLIGLQAQINPHFLYNTLDSTRWIALRSGNKEIARILEALACFYKHTLNQGNTETTVAQEIRHVNDYMLIQRSRFGERISYEIHYDKELEEMRTMNLVLQPLVENAILHGLESKLGDGHIRIDIYCDDVHLIYTVQDDGLGCDPEKVRKQLSSGEENGMHALRNIHQRLLYKYGTDYGVHFESTVGQGTTVTVRIPIEGDKKDETIDR